MSVKYIPQLNNQNFVYPNAYLAEYDVDLVQDINDNSVSGFTTGFTATTATSTGITISFYYNWSKNNAEVFKNINGQISIISVHMMAPGQTYYKPWRTVFYRSSTDPNVSSSSGTVTIPISTTLAAVTSFTSGTYYFEIRFIGSKAIYPVCQTLSITI